MKTLLVMRHAKSSWKEAAQADETRPLNKRGRRDAPRMGRLLREKGLVPQAIVSSTAERARQTAIAAAEASGFEGEIQFEASLYAAPAEAYLALLHGMAPELQIVMVVGHNPGVDELVDELTGEDEHLSTGSIARIELPIERWEDLSPETEARLETSWRPREQDK
jgi:phosphohistidine phosphatase